LTSIVWVLGCGHKSQHESSTIFVSSEDNGTIAVIDGATRAVERTISIGKRPRGLRVSHDGRWLFAAVSGSPKGGPGVDERTLPPADRSADGIAVVDLSTFTVTRVLSSGQDPETFAVSADDKRIFVSNEETAMATEVDVATGNVVRTIPVGTEPEGVGIRPDGAYVYVTGETSNDVTVASTQNGIVVAHIAVGARPRNIIFSRKKPLAFVSAEQGDDVRFVDTNANATIETVKLPGGARPMGMALSPDEQTLWVTTGRARSVVGIDVASRQVATTINDIGARPWGIASSDDGKTLWVANGPSNDVAVIDAEHGTLLTKIHVDGSPWGIVVVPVVPKVER
jgi:YVTN family beta-propeller protein